MAGARFSSIKRLQSSIKCSLNLELIHQHHYSVDMNLVRIARLPIARFPSDSLSHLSSKGELHSPKKVSAKNSFSGLASESLVNSHLFNSKTNASCYRRYSSFCSRSIFPSAPTTHMLNCRKYSSSVDGKGSREEGTEVFAGSGVSEMNSSGDSFVNGDWGEQVRNGWKSVVETATHGGQKVKEAYDELTPHAQQLLDSYPYLNTVVIPVSATLSATLIAWVLMPRILRKFHQYAMQGPISLLPGSLSGESVPYEKSFWAAMEDPLRYLAAFIAFTQIGLMVAPTTIPAQYLAPAWRGAVILSFVWFLHRWKTNVFARTLSSQSLLGLDREKLLAIDKISSIGLFVIGIMALAEACGVAVQSIVTVGGVGGVASAFAARDILGNVFSGLSMQFSKPFSIGDTIKAGSVEGKVIEMGLTSTSLLSAEKFPVIVPNSFFSSQVIANKSRAEYCAIVTKIPLQTEDLSKIPQISEEIRSMLRANVMVYSENDVPYCFLSHIESSNAILTLGYNLKSMRKDELYKIEEDILLQAVRIIKNHGAALGTTSQDKP